MRWPGRGRTSTTSLRATSPRLITSTFAGAPPLAALPNSPVFVRERASLMSVRDVSYSDKPGEIDFFRNIGMLPIKATTRQRKSTSFMLWAWTRSSRRSRPATAGLCHRRPEVAYPAICLPGTGCDGSHRPGGVGSVTLCGCKLWSRYSARSSRVGDSGSSCCGD